MPPKTEREGMLKAIGKVNNKWELLAFIWAFRQKEFWKWIAGVESVIILMMLTKYTDFFETIYQLFKGFLL